jgi:hypothetical protein
MRTTYDLWASRAVASWGAPENLWTNNSVTAFLVAGDEQGNVFVLHTYSHLLRSDLLERRYTVGVGWQKYRVLAAPKYDRVFANNPMRGFGVAVSSGGPALAAWTWREPDLPPPNPDMIAGSLYLPATGSGPTTVLHTADAESIVPAYLQIPPGAPVVAMNVRGDAIVVWLQREGPSGMSLRAKLFQ